MVRLTALVLSLGLFWIAAPSDADASSCRDERNIHIDNGACWNSLSEPVRLGIIQGLLSGVEVGDISYAAAGHFRNPEGLNLAMIPRGKKVEDISQYFNSLYASQENKEIRWKNAYLLAALKLRDDDSNDEARLLKLLQEGKEIPTLGSIVGVSGPDEIQVKFKEKTYNVGLAGLSTEGVSSSAGQQAQRFLRALASAEALSCGTGLAPLVELHYNEDVFDDKGRISAYLSYSKYNKLCSGGPSPTVSEVLGVPENLSVNEFMLVNGLLPSQSAFDPKWSEDRKRSRGLPAEYNSMKAKLDGMYIWGTSVNQRMERLMSYFNER